MVDEILCQTRCGAVQEKNQIQLSVIEERLLTIEDNFKGQVTTIDERLKGFVALTDEHFECMDKVLDLKTIEMNRRLVELNELRSEVVKDRNLLVQKGEYDLKMRGIDNWVDVANEKLTILMVNYNNRISLAHWLSIGAIVISIVNIALIIFYKT
jgi:hypothetical protein